MNIAAMYQAAHETHEVRRMQEPTSKPRAPTERCAIHPGCEQTGLSAQFGNASSFGCLAQLVERRPYKP
jgi:hypothetical protein